jgi:hypothetical protein
LFFFADRQYLSEFSRSEEFALSAKDRAKSLEMADQIDGCDLA